MGMCEFGYASEPHGANSNLRRKTSEIGSSRLRSTRSRAPVWKSKFYGTFVLNRRVVLHAIDPTHWLVSTQAGAPDAVLARECLHLFFGDAHVPAASNPSPHSNEDDWTRLRTSP